MKTAPKEKHANVIYQNACLCHLRYGQECDSRRVTGMIPSPIHVLAHQAGSRQPVESSWRLQTQSILQWLYVLDEGEWRVSAYVRGCARRLAGCRSRRPQSACSCGSPPVAESLVRTLMGNKNLREGELT